MKMKTSNHSVTSEAFTHKKELMKKEIMIYEKNYTLMTKTTTTIMEIHSAIYIHSPYSRCSALFSYISIKSERICALGNFFFCSMF